MLYQEIDGDICSDLKSVPVKSRKIKGSTSSASISVDSMKSIEKEKGRNKWILQNFFREDKKNILWGWFGSRQWIPPEMLFQVEHYLISKISNDSEDHYHCLMYQEQMKWSTRWLEILFQGRQMLFYIHKTLRPHIEYCIQPWEPVDDQTSSGMPKPMDSEALLQSIQANSASSTQRVSGELSISESITSVKVFWTAKLYFTLPKDCKTFDTRNTSDKFPVTKQLQGTYDKFPDFFCMGTFIGSTHMKL